MIIFGLQFRKYKNREKSFTKAVKSTYCINVNERKINSDDFAVNIFQQVLSDEYLNFDEYAKAWPYDYFSSLIVTIHLTSITS